MGRYREISFTKMTGAGNDFVLVDARGGMLELDWGKLAPILCDRRYGIGADGLLVLKDSTLADFGMDYFNADGSYGGMCGNGGRCAAQFVLEERGGSEVKFESLDYVYGATRSKSEIQLRMKQPKLYRNGTLEAFGKSIFFHSIDTGTAHCVLFMDQMDEALRARIAQEGINPLGSFIRHHPEFAPGGTNVDFVDLKEQPPVLMRTFERGVEDETLACGTGAVASAVVAHIVRGIRPPVRIQTRSKEILTVDFAPSPEPIDNVVLTGSAVIVYHGRYRVST
jgi:diaminopimelate epimerase